MSGPDERGWMNRACAISGPHTASADSSSRPAIYTIGHSSHRLEPFLNTLESHDITLVLDVRSIPYSRRHPQFSRESLINALKVWGIGYEFLGDALGARGKGMDLLFPDGKVDFAKVRDTDRFREGIASCREIAVSGVRAALLCAEKDPFDCHRFMLVSRELEPEIEVRHILEDSTIVVNDALERRLIERYDQPGLFEPVPSYPEALSRAYRSRNQEMWRGRGLTCP